MAARKKSKVTPKYKTTNRRRSWRKLHLGLDDDGVIVAYDLTASTADDASVEGTMIEQVEPAIGRFTADGAYDTRGVYEALEGKGTTNVRIVIPPMRTATMDPRATGTWGQRNDVIARIAEVGRRHWRKESGAQQQARAENGMYRDKRLIGDRLRSKLFDSQKREALIAVNAINRMTALGMPESVKVAA